jgi:hypothetical protein
MIAQKKAENEMALQRKVKRNAKKNGDGSWDITDTTH